MRYRGGRPGVNPQPGAEPRRLAAGAEPLSQEQLNHNLRVDSCACENNGFYLFIYFHLLLFLIENNGFCCKPSRFGSCLLHSITVAITSMSCKPWTRESNWKVDSVCPSSSRRKCSLAEQTSTAEVPRLWEEKRYGQNIAVTASSPRSGPELEDSLG